MDETDIDVAIARAVKKALIRLHAVHGKRAKRTKQVAQYIRAKFLKQMDVRDIADRMARMARRGGMLNRYVNGIGDASEFPGSDLEWRLPDIIKTIQQAIDEVSAPMRLNGEDKTTRIGDAPPMAEFILAPKDCAAIAECVYREMRGRRMLKDTVSLSQVTRCALRLGDNSQGTLPVQFKSGIPGGIFDNLFSDNLISSKYAARR